LGLASRLQLKELIKMAEAVGGKHGMFPKTNEKRSKNAILRWIRARIDILETDLRRYVAEIYGPADP
jgi:hypothetical protein